MLNNGHINVDEVEYTEIADLARLLHHAHHESEFLLVVSKIPIERFLPRWCAMWFHAHDHILHSTFTLSLTQQRSTFTSLHFVIFAVWMCVCVAMRGSVLQCVAVCCSVLQCVAMRGTVMALRYVPGQSLQHTATHCNTLWWLWSACLSDTLQHNVSIYTTRLWYRDGGEDAVTHCSTLQHTATHCNTLQHTALHCNTLQQIHIYNTRQHTVNTRGNTL